jgi:membrane fusion protein, multidrug efflux system
VKITLPKRSSIILWGLLVLLLVMVALSVTMRREEVAVVESEEKATPVQTRVLARQSALDQVRLPGRIEPDMRAHLAVDKGGRVVEILADRGDRVEADQVLLRIDDRVWQSMQSRAEIELADAERAYERWTALAASGTVSTSEYDTVRTRLDQARVQLDEARIHVAQCEVRSPADGVINDRFVEVGEFAPEGSAVLDLVVSDPAKLTVQVPERDVVGIGAGKVLPFTLAVYPGMVFTGVVTHVAEAGSSANNTFRLEARVPNPDGQLRPGMISSVELVRARRQEALVVPLSAVIPRQGDHFVYLAREDRAVRRLVKLDRILGTDVVIADGLEAGEELIIEGHRTLVDGSLIERVQ